MEEWVVAKTFPGPVFAEMAKELLLQHEIPSVIKKDFFSAAYGTAGTIQGSRETKLFVPEGQLEEAQNILSTEISDD